MTLINLIAADVEGYCEYMEDFERFVKEEIKNEGYERLVDELKEIVDIISCDVTDFTVTCEVKESFKSQCEHIVYEFSVKKSRFLGKIKVVYKGFKM